MNKQTILTGFLILIIVSLISFVVFGSKNNNVTKVSNNQNVSKTIPVNDKTPIFYYGNTCPHCADVEAWMKENRIEEKITISKKEVYDNRQNSEELTQVAESCGLPTDSIGVPFLSSEGKCIIGTPDIINYLTEKSAVSESSSSAERSVK